MQRDPHVTTHIHTVKHTARTQLFIEKRITEPHKRQRERERERKRDKERGIEREEGRVNQFAMWGMTLQNKPRTDKQTTYRQTNTSWTNVRIRRTHTQRRALCGREKDKQM